MQLQSGIPDMGKIYVKYTAENLSHFTIARAGERAPASFIYRSADF